ncbi:MAG: flagellar motor protein MotD [Panacagrimonas sp.]
MAKKKKHEDHINHEAWAIPYGDLITLLLAFFVVMYSMSSVNEGKYRVLSDSLNAAFGGAPRSTKPIQLGPKAQSSTNEARPRVLPGAPSQPGVRGMMQALHKPDLPGLMPAKMSGDGGWHPRVGAREREQLEKMSDEVHAALGDLIAEEQVIVRRHEEWLEIEIQTDILFASGSARLGEQAGGVLDRLADVLGDFDNRLRIEGHTDDVPIATREFPSNWELSSARAASVVHRFMARGVEPRRMTVLGLSEYHPAADNGDPDGRNRNRRVVVVVMANPGGPPTHFDGLVGPVPPAPPTSPSADFPPPARAAASIGAEREHAEP